MTALSTTPASSLPSPVTMRAVLQGAYGLPDVLALGSVPRPEVPEDGVLVRIAAAGLNKGDWHILTGKPYLVRLAGYGLVRPTRPIPGMAVAGRVEAVGSAVRRFAVGDEVFGELNRGGFAEYACARESELAKVPSGVSLEQAAALPVAATTALQGLRDAGGLQPGQSVLVNGAAGGVGTYAVQIAKALGAVVTGVCSAGNVDLVRSLGADHVLDYATADFTRGDARYDLVFDLVGNRPLAEIRRVLTPTGRMIACAGGAENEWVGPMPQVLAGLLSNILSKQPFVSLMAKPNTDDLATVAGMVAAGTVRPVIDRRCPLEGVPDAMRHLGEGHSRGRTVVTL